MPCRHFAYDKDDNVLWATNFAATEDYIYKVDPDAGTVLDSVKVTPIINANIREGFTGIKYDPNTKHLFLQQVDGPAAGPWTSDIYEVTTSGVVVTTVPLRPLMEPEFMFRGDTLLSSSIDWVPIRRRTPIKLCARFCR